MGKASAIAKQSKKVAAPAPPAEAQPIETLRESVTIETLAYAGLVLLAAFLRLAHLSAAPLTTAEASQALAAYNGTPLPLGGSPLLYALNQIVFGLSRTSLGDAGARVAAALLGSAAVLLPWLFRKSIGQWGALAASLALAISPTIVFASRLLDGQAIAATLALVAVGFGLRHADLRQQRDLNRAAVAIGLALTSGPGVVTVLIVISLGLLMAYRWLASEDDRARLTEMRMAGAALREAGLWGAAAMVLVTSTVLLNPGGLRGIPEMVSAWLAAWRAIDTIGPLQIFQVLLVYEPLIVWAGLAGLIVAVRRMTITTVVLGVWSIGALLLALGQPGRQIVDLTLTLVPLALLAGLAVQHLIDALIDRGNWGFEGAVWLIAAPLIGYLFVTLGGYATGHNVIGNAQVLGQTLSPLASFVVLMAILALIVGGVFALAMGLGAVLRAGATAALVVFALVSIGNVWSVTQLRPSDPRELHWGPIATAPDVRPMIQAIEAASWRATGNAEVAPVTVSLPQTEPVIAWYLRGFQNVQFASTSGATPPIVITALGETPQTVTGGYVGAKFVTRSAWSPSALDNAALLRWWVYRQAGEPLATQTLVVWVKPLQ
ncbi:MAG: glycosyltransferase family 39 protein [Thermoflexales bacterium]|nr:glycosyltransferase family 39 protein [Thermoflexales bacterium]